MLCRRRIWASCPKASTLVGTWDFHGGNILAWQIELDTEHTLTEIFQELGHMELRALGYLKHGVRLARHRRA
jgi:hypothetical protein